VAHVAAEFEAGDLVLLIGIVGFRLKFRKGLAGETAGWGAAVGQRVGRPARAGGGGGPPAGGGGGGGVWAGAAAPRPLRRAGARRRGGGRSGAMGERGRSRERSVPLRGTSRKLA